MTVAAYGANDRTIRARGSTSARRSLTAAGREQPLRARVRRGVHCRSVYCGVWVPESRRCQPGRAGVPADLAAVVAQIVAGFFAPLDDELALP